jgi:PAS domain S-box-containing protein
MTLRYKTRLIIGSMFLGLIVILYFLAENVLLGGYGDTPRDIRELEFAIAYLMLMLVGVGLVFGIVTIFLLEKQVLSRLSRLSSNIHNIGTSGDISTRVSVPGTDELSILAGTINGMLAALEQSETELRRSEEQHRLLAENARDVIYSMDVNLKFTYVSPSVTPLTGYSVEEAKAQTLDKVLAPASFDLARKTFAEEQAIENTEQKDLYRSQTLELEVKRKDGSTVWLEAGMTPLRNREHQVIGILGVARDITERKQADAKLQELYNKEKGLREELEEEISKRVEFTRALVHELKTPITPVLASSDLLLQKLEDKPLLNLAENINQGAYNLNQRIDELLDLARGEIGMLYLNPEPVDPLPLLQRIVNQGIPVAMRNKQSLIVELPSSLPEVWADEVRLRQIVLNLMNNAFKFTPPEGKITLRAKHDSANLIVEVQDTGFGISPEEQTQLFEPYHRLTRDRERLSGLGLGLSLAKKFLELHGGKIWVKSEKGKGSTFGFSIPLEPLTKEKTKEGEG